MYKTELATLKRDFCFPELFGLIGWLASTNVFEAGQP